MYACNSPNYLGFFWVNTGQNLKSSGHLGFLSFSGRVQNFTLYGSVRAGSSQVGSRPDPALMSGHIKELSYLRKKEEAFLNEMKFATTNNRSEKICVKA